MGYSFRYAIEFIAFFACACGYTIDTLRYEFIYQIVSEDLNYTTNNSVHYCLPNQTESAQTQDVTSEASRWTLYSSLAGNIANSFGAWIITARSDQIGRKKAIAFPLFGMLIAAILQLIIVIFRLPLYSFIVSKFILGAFGGNAALLAVGSAHLGDTVKEEDRGKRYTILEVFASVGGGAVLMGTGYWINSSGFIPSSILLVACAFVSLLFVPFLSNTQEKNSENPCTSGEESFSKSSTDNEGKTEFCVSEIHDDDDKSRCSWLKEWWRIYSTENCVCKSCKGSKTKSSNHVMRRGLWRLWFYALSYAFYNFSLNGIFVFRTMFLVSYPVCFTPELVGIQAGIENVLFIVCPVVLILLQKCLKLGGQSILVLGNLARISFCIMMSFAIAPPMVFGATCFGLLFNFTTSFMRSEASRLVPNSEQGAALSVLSGLESVTNAFASTLFLTIYPMTLSISYGFMWIVTAICFCVPFSMMMTVWVANRIHKIRRLKKVEATEDEKETI